MKTKEKLKKVMKPKKKKAAKKELSLWGKASLKMTELKDWVLFNWDDEDLLFGVLLVLFGAGLLQGWLNPVAWLAWLAIVWGGAKVYSALK